MCGIIGYIGYKQALPLLLEGLERLEYRGYDSAGVAVFDGNKINVEKQIGKITNLKKKLAKHPFTGTLGIGHTRWATHGGVTNKNAHPHCDCYQNVAVIHNGIIENYLELKESLTAKGHRFLSQTDSEVLAHLIEEKYNELTSGLRALGFNGKQLCKGNNLIFEATRRAILMLEGAYSIVLIHKNHPDCIIASRLFSPLIIGVGKQENFVASDIPALLQHTNQIIDLDDHHLAKISATKVEIIDLNGTPLQKTPRTINFSLENAEKQGFPHFLIKEIHESSRVVHDVLRGKTSKNNLPISSSVGILSTDSTAIEHIHLIACGTAYYASLIGKHLFEHWAKTWAEATTASEYRYQQSLTTAHSLIIGVSQSGETADTLAGMRKVKKQPHQTLLALTNIIGSSITRLIPPENVILLNAGPEISVASTKAFTSMVVVLALLALTIALEKKHISSHNAQHIIKELKTIPEKIQTVLENKKQIARIAMQYVKWNSMYYIGRGINYPTALEGALKLKEISYIHAEGYAAGEMKHGPIAVLEKGFPVIAIATKSTTYEKMLSNIQEAVAREADIIAVVNNGDHTIKKIAKHIIEVPTTIEEFSPILNNVALQLFAYYTALYKGFSIDNPRSLEKFYPDPDDIKHPPKAIDIDKPRNLAKSVTVE